MVINTRQNWHRLGAEHAGEVAEHGAVYISNLNFFSVALALFAGADELGFGLIDEARVFVLAQDVEEHAAVLAVKK